LIEQVSFAINFGMARVVPRVIHIILRRGATAGSKYFFQMKIINPILILWLNGATHFNVGIWNYCLTPNHTHLLAAAGYIEQNSVGAGLVKRAEEYQMIILYRAPRTHQTL